MNPVRMLRAVRLAVKLDCSIAKGTATPIREHSELIKNVPPARLFDETEAPAVGLCQRYSGGTAQAWPRGMACCRC